MLLLNFQAVQEYYHLRVRKAVAYAPSASMILKASGMAAASRDLVTFDDGSVVVVTESDLEGYNPSIHSSTMGSEIWADLSVVYRVRVAGQAALARISCLWLRYGTHQKVSAQKLGSTNQLGGISVDIHVY